MKRIILFAVAIATVFLVLAAPAFAAVDDQDWRHDEIIWKYAQPDWPYWGVFVGDVWTKIDDGQLTAVFYARPGYAFIDTAIAVADDSLSAIPHSKGGPVPGRFIPPYGGHNDYSSPVQTSTYQITLPSTWELPIYVVAHATVMRLSDGLVETGWGTGCTDLSRWNYPGHNWARYFTIPGE